MEQLFQANICGCNSSQYRRRCPESCEWPEPNICRPQRVPTGAHGLKVAVATANCVPFLATSAGRHGYSPSFGQLVDGLAIDLSNLNTVHVNAEANLMTVGGGVRIKDILEPLYRVGKELRKYSSVSCDTMVGGSSSDCCTI
jgi:hypothetical protein